MNYIQIDNFNGNINIVCKEDGSGEPLIFNNLKEAKDTLEENCQNGFIIPLNIDIMKILEECEQFISTILFEEGKENFDGIQPLCDSLDEILDLKIDIK